MAETTPERQTPNGLTPTAWAAIVLVVLIAAVAVWMIVRPSPEPEQLLPLPPAAPSPEEHARAYAAITPLPLSQAGAEIASLDGDARAFGDPGPGYVYSLARMGTLAGRPTRVWEAAVLSRMAFEFHYFKGELPFPSDVFIDRAVTLFLRNAGLEADRFESQQTGPGTVDQAEQFVRKHLAAGRPVLFDFFEWGLYTGIGKQDDKEGFMGLVMPLKPDAAGPGGWKWSDPQFGSMDSWRGGLWWQRKGTPPWVHDLVAVTAVYQQESKVEEATRSARSAVLIATLKEPDTTDIPQPYVPMAKVQTAGLRSYDELATAIETKTVDPGLWLAGFPVQRLCFGRHSAAVYFKDAAEQFAGGPKEALLAAAAAFQAEYESWLEYLKLGEKSDEDTLKQKIELVKKARAAQVQATAGLDRFRLENVSAGKAGSN